MHIERLFVRNFRNYEQGDWFLSPGINLFYGENAQGKTNLLEAVYYCGVGRSHRTNQEEDLIRWEENQLAVAAQFSRQGISHTLQLTRARQPRKKEIKLDKQAIRAKEQLGEMPVVLFSPEDLQLIKGEPAQRRRFLDLEISQSNHRYYQDLMRYQRIVLQRNKLLKAIREGAASRSDLDAWDEPFCEGAACLLTEREKAVAHFSHLANEIHLTISGEKEELRVDYQIADGEKAPFGSDKANWRLWYEKKLQGNRIADIARGSTGIGPHRDDLLFLLKEGPFKAFASQGQQRTAVLSLKIAELTFVQQAVGFYPVLLLDDVMSELDQRRRDHLLNFISGKIQTFITGTECVQLHSDSAAACFLVQNGRLGDGGNGAG